VAEMKPFYEKSSSFICSNNVLAFVKKYSCPKGGEDVPNLNDNKFKKIQSESQKQGKTYEEYAAELEENKMKAQKRK
jgi:hypothetical protein